MEEKVRNMVRAILREDRIALRFVKSRWPDCMDELSVQDMRRGLDAWVRSASMEELMQAMETVMEEA
jgi:hypothetical protein